MNLPRHISRDTYKKAKENLDKLIEGVWIMDQQKGKIYKTKPDINAIKYAIDKYDEQIEKRKLLS